MGISTGVWVDKRLPPKYFQPQRSRSGGCEGGARGARHPLARATVRPGGSTQRPRLTAGRRLASRCGGVFAHELAAAVFVASD